MRRVSHAFELIGKTPIVKINTMNPNPHVKIYAKLEGYNPTGSVKDRIALPMVEKAEKEGALTKGKTILEATSGNTGISIAWVAALKGYNCTILMPRKASIERKRILRALGAKIVLADSEREVVETARKMAKCGHYFVTDQFMNEENWKAHFLGTGEEIWRQTRGKITHFVAGIGTSGTLMGVAARLRLYNRSVRIVGVQPTDLNNRQEGLLNLSEFCPEIFDAKRVDEIIQVEDRDAFKTCRDLFLKEGLFVGISSGSVMYGAIQRAREIEEGFIVALFADNGFKYLSTGLFKPERRM